MHRHFDGWSGTTRTEAGSHAATRRRRGTLLAGLCLLAGAFQAAAAGAAVNAYEGFKYSAGATTPLLTGGTGWAGGWTANGAVVVAPGLTYPVPSPVPSVTGFALGHTPGSAATRALSGVTTTSGSSLVLSALIRSDVAGTPATQATLGNSGGGTFVIGDLPQSDAAAGNWGLQTAAGRFYSNVPVAANATTYLVAQIDFNVAGSNDRVRLWVNPSGTSWFTATPAVDDSSADIPSFNGVFWQTQQGQVVDEIRVVASAAACVAPPNTTMVVWYPFDETSGGLARNLATGNDGLLTNGPTPVPGLVGGALRFDGIDDFVYSLSTIATNMGPASTASYGSGRWSASRGDFAIDAWVRVPSTVSSSRLMVVFDKRSGNVPNIHGYYLHLANNGMALQLADGLGNGFTNYASDTLPANIALYDGNWHHVAVTVNRKSKTGIRFYHNGKPLGVRNPTDRLGSLVNDSPLGIGTRSAAPPLTAWFEGDIDELEVFNRALTAPEVASLFNAGPFGKCKK